MKNLLIWFSFTFLLPQWAASQYSWFNRLYNLEGGGVLTTAMNVRGDSLECIGIGGGSDENHPLQHVVDKYDINIPDGILLNETFCFPDEPIGGLLPERACAKLDDGSWLHYMYLFSECGMQFPTVLHMTPDLSLISQRSLTEIIDCEDKDYFTDAMLDLGNSEYLLTTRVYFGWPVADSTGHYYHKMNLNGDIVESRTVMHPNYGTDRTYHHVMRSDPNSLIIYGEAGENFTAIGPFIQKTDLWGNPSHELIINNDDLVWGEMGSGIINYENDLIYAHANTLYYNNGQNYGEFELFVKRINTDSLHIIENKQVELPYLVGNTYSLFNINRIIQTIDGGYLLMIDIGNDGGGYTGLLKIDAELNHEWFKTYHPEGWQTYEIGIGFEIINTPDGGYAIAGRYNGKGWVVKLDHCGNEIESGCEEIISVEENSMTENHLHLYPNPASNEITINTSSLKLKPQWLQVYSTDGRLEWEEKMRYDDSTLKISLNKIPSGNYFVVLKDDKGQLIAKEMLVKI